MRTRARAGASLGRIRGAPCRSRSSLILMPSPLPLLTISLVNRLSVSQNTVSFPGRFTMATSIAESPARVTTNASEQLLQIATGFQLSACLYVAAKLNIADLVAHAERSAEDLAASTGTNADALYRVLRALISVGIFTEPKPHIIALSPGAEPLRRDVPGSVHGLVLWAADPFMVHMASDLLYSVETG